MYVIIYSHISKFEKRYIDLSRNRTRVEKHVQQCALETWYYSESEQDCINWLLDFYKYKKKNKDYLINTKYNNEKLVRIEWYNKINTDMYEDMQILCINEVRDVMKDLSSEDKE